jgi:hypothetical protein
MACSIACNILGNSVTLRFPDGNESEVPLEIVNRSKVLQDSFCTTHSDGEFLVGASAVHLRSWLECVRSIHSDKANEVKLASAKSVETLAEYLEVR